MSAGIEPPEIRLANVTKQFREVTAVDDVSLTVDTGEFLTLLGPSGCGKTTTLRMIGGFDLPTRGRIELRGRDVTADPPDRRPVNMVFQSYALFPHLDVAGNIAFGLKRRGVASDEIRRRTGAILDKVHLSGYERRRTHELSGGQQQRVALARALVNHPTVLLLDEPLGALDLKLRKQLQLELKRIQMDVGITFVYVTHDQEEALTMSDRIAVMSQGRVEQVGKPKEIYENPATAYVADFLGVSNLMDAEAAGPGPDGCRVKLGAFELLAGQGEPDAVGPCKVTIRPERIDIEPQGTAGENRIPGMVERVVYVGATLQVFLHLASGQTIQAWIPNDGDAQSRASGDAIMAYLPADALRVLPGGGTAVLAAAELDVASG